MRAPRTVSFEEIDSTSSEAFRRADAGDAGSLWITAARQSAGRGRRRRPWVSEPGNLHASLLLRPHIPGAVAGQLSFVAALALFDAAADSAPALAPALKLKWPNDLLIGEAKVAGILLESTGGPGGTIDTLVIGFGVNCAHHPEDTPYPATSFAAEDALVTPETLFAALKTRFAETYDRWEEGKGFDAIRAAWLARAAGQGEELTVRFASGNELTGTFIDVDDAGNLLLRAADGQETRVAAGDVFFGAAKAGTNAEKT